MSDQPFTNIVNDAINATKPLVKLVAMAEAAAISVVTDKKELVPEVSKAVDDLYDEIKT
ncbi:hypothetical protein I4U23_005061 [Adineta vaga]|nr:hypothetical protein I4U23_005061 [Adineta vaga]